MEAELHYGVRRSARRRANHARLEVLLANVDSVPFDSRAAVLYGKIREDLESSGMPIGPNDLLIAAHAMALERILVTDNVAEFGRVAGLRVEIWRETPQR